MAHTSTMVVLAALAAVFFELKRGVADAEISHCVLDFDFNALHFRHIACHHVCCGGCLGGAYVPHEQVVNLFNAVNLADVVGEPQRVN